MLFEAIGSNSTYLPMLWALLDPRAFYIPKAIKRLSSGSLLKPFGSSENQTAAHTDARNQSRISGNQVGITSLESIDEKLLDQFPKSKASKSYVIEKPKLNAKELRDKWVKAHQNQ